MTRGDWLPVRTFLADVLSDSHPVLDERLFFWQYRGFGPLEGIGECQVAFDGDVVCGFRGVIPGLYQVPVPQGGYELAPGGSGSVWAVDDRLHGTGIGRSLWMATEGRLRVRTSLGARTDTAVPFYERSGFTGVPGLHHWYVALDPDGFSDLAFGSWDRSELTRWCDSVTSGAETEPSRLDGDELEHCWRSFSAAAGDVFSLHRNRSFWEWRYLRHPYFDYLLFGGDGAPATVVARVENVSLPSASHRALRIIEIVPAGAAGWADAGSSALAAFIRGILVWSRALGCVAADHRAVSTRLGAVLRDAGFEMNPFESPETSARGLSGLLTPFRTGPRPINAHWKVGDGGRAAIAAEDVYIVKSDSDMDRPNVPAQELAALASDAHRRA